MIFFLDHDILYIYIYKRKRQERERKLSLYRKRLHSTQVLMNDSKNYIRSLHSI